jgi:acyl carrier protein
LPEKQSLKQGFLPNPLRHHFLHSKGEMMNSSDIKATIRNLITEIAEDMEIDASKITDDAHFITGMGLDSMALLEVLATMEKKFGITIPETEFPNIVTINKCTETVEKYLVK